MAKKPDKHPATAALPTKPSMVERFEAISMMAAAKLHLPFMQTWLSAYFHPAETCEKERQKASIKNTVTTLLVFYFAFAALFFILAALSYSVAGASQLSSGSKTAFNPFDYILQVLVLGPISDTAFMFVALFLLFISSKIMGGRATFSQQSYAISLVFCGGMSIAVVFASFAFAALMLTSLFAGFSLINMLAMVIGPLFALAFLPLVLASLLYGIYSYYRMIKCVHKLSGIRAAGALACTVALIILLNLLLTVILS